jgi:2,4-dichlorophenol 6-monooxygenase
VLAGKAGSGLLETYGQERRPVAQRNAEQSLESFFDHGQIDAAIGLAPDLAPEAGWAAVAERFADTPAGAEKRAALGLALRNKRHEFCAQNLEIGYCYETGAIVPDGSPLPGREDDVTDFIPSSHPGHRLPHAWLEGGSGRVSTFWLTRPDRLLLLVGPGGDAWRAAAAAASERLGVELEVAGIGPGQEYADPTGQWAAQSEVEADGAILVRPDQHVAWRSPAVAADPERTLAAALGEILSLPA